MMRTWAQAILISGIIAGAIVLAVISIVREPSRNSYGVKARYFGRTLEYPDFCLRFVRDHESEDRRITYYDFDILDRGDLEKRGTFCYHVSGLRVTQFFRFRGRLYVTEMDFTEPPGGWIKGDSLSLAEITVWDESAAEVSRPDLIEDARFFEKEDAKHPRNGQPNKPPEAMAVKCPPSNPPQAPAMPHL